MMTSRNIFSRGGAGVWTALLLGVLAWWFTGFSHALAQSAGASPYPTAAPAAADTASPAAVPADAVPAVSTASPAVGDSSDQLAVPKNNKHKARRRHRRPGGSPVRMRAVPQPDGTKKLMPVEEEGDAAPVPGHPARQGVQSAASAQKTQGSAADKIWKSTGLYGFISNRYYVTCPNPGCHNKIACEDAQHHPRYCSKCMAMIPRRTEVQTDFGWTHLVMIVISLVLMYLAIVKEFEPLLLLPIGFGGLLSNIPLAGIADPGGFLYAVRDFGINPDSCLFPLLIFMGVGAMTDFGPLIANPRTALLGGAAQFGIFTSLIGAVLLNDYMPGIEFSLKDAASIGIIGGADGPTSIFLSSKLSPNLVGSIAVAAYSYMALVPIIQPPIMRFLTTKEERGIVMKQLRPVSKLEKVIFPLVVLLLCAIFLPSAAPLIGALMFGNLAKECNVVGRLSDTMQNAMMNIVTILLGLCVGSKLAAEVFLTPKTLGILALGLLAFCIGTASGVLLAKLMNKLSPKNPVNPLIGAAGVSAVPMAARVANKVGMEENPGNVLLMNAMGPNVAGVIGSAVAAGVLLAFLG